jgi:hypothetical protein
MSKPNFPQTGFTITSKKLPNSENMDIPYQYMARVTPSLIHVLVKGVKYIFKFGKHPQENCNVEGWKKSGKSALQWIRGKKFQEQYNTELEIRNEGKKAKYKKVCFKTLRFEYNEDGSIKDDGKWPTAM